MWISEGAAAIAAASSSKMVSTGSRRRPLKVSASQAAVVKPVLVESIQSGELQGQVLGVKEALRPVFADATQ